MDKDFLHRQLVKLGDMMADGLHYEPGGKWIEKEYGKILRALGYDAPIRKNNSKNINELMIDRVKSVKCGECSGDLKQVRSGSMVAKCINCGAKYRLLKRQKSKQNRKV